MGPLRDNPPRNIDFFEVAPENWIGIGGKMGKDFRHFTERYPFVCHGLSLSIGSPAPLDETFVHRIRRFLDEREIEAYLFEVQGELRINATLLETNQNRTTHLNAKNRIDPAHWESACAYVESFVRQGDIF